MLAIRPWLHVVALISFATTVLCAVDDATAGEVFASLTEAARTEPLVRAVLEHGADAIPHELTDGLPAQGVRVLIDAIPRLIADPEPVAGVPDVLVSLPVRPDARKDRISHAVGRLLYAYPKRRPSVLVLTADEGKDGLRVSIGREPPTVSAEFTAVALRAEAAKRRMIVDFRDPRVPCPIGDECWKRLKSLPTWTAIGEEEAVLRRRPDEYESLGDRIDDAGDGRLKRFIDGLRRRDDTVVCGAVLAQIGLFAVKSDGSAPIALEYDPELTDAEFAAFVKDGRNPHLPLPPAVPLVIERLERALDGDNPAFLELVDGPRVQSVRDLLSRELGKTFTSRERLPPFQTVEVEAIGHVLEGGGSIRRHRYAYTVRRSGIIAYGAVGLDAFDRERTYKLKQGSAGWRVEDVVLSPAKPNR